jgi:hypothetical protein
VALLLIVAYRMSPRRVSASEAVLLVGFGTAALWSSRMIVWWAPLAAYYLVLHGSAAWKRWRKQARAATSSAGRPAWLVATVGLVWIFFAYSPFGVTLLHGRQKERLTSYSRATPIGAVEYLREHPPKGIVFNTYEWGDYLLWAGPQGIQVFVASHAHLIPEEIWTDYMDTIGGRTRFEQVLDQYGMNTAVIDALRNEALVRRLRTDEGWRIGYEDAIAVVFVRKDPESEERGAEAVH